jgi:hypothetical protein
LERAWLEYERAQGRERAILQIQALEDEHSNRLAISQSTLDSVKDSAPLQERLLQLHTKNESMVMVQDKDLCSLLSQVFLITTEGKAERFYLLIQAFLSYTIDNSIDEGPEAYDNLW